MAKVKIGNVKGPQGEQGPQGPTGATGATGQVDASTAIEFSENSSYANIESGESIATIFGKLKKIAGGILAGAGSTLLGANLTADRVLLSNSDGKITASTITATELSYLDGLTGNVQQNINSLTEKREWTKVSFKGAVDVTASIPSDKCARVPSTAEEICVEITVKRNASTSIKFSQYLKTYGAYLGGYYYSDKYYASYQLGYSNNIIYMYKSWLKVVDNGAEYDNTDIVQVDVYYR